MKKRKVCIVILILAIIALLIGISYLVQGIYARGFGEVDDQHDTDGKGIHGQAHKEGLEPEAEQLPRGESLHLRPIGKLGEGVVVQPRAGADIQVAAAGGHGAGLPGLPFLRVRGEQDTVLGDSHSPQAAQQFGDLVQGVPVSLRIIAAGSIFIIGNRDFRGPIILREVCLHHALRQGDETAGVGLQEGRQLPVVHLYRLDHADDLQVLLLGELGLQSAEALLLLGDLLLGLFNIMTQTHGTLLISES